VSAVRVPPIPPGTRPELADQEARIAAARGRVSPLYQVLLNSPALAHGWEQMLSAVRNHNSIDAALRELVILRVAVLNEAPYEFEAHAPIALAAGVTQEALQAVREVPPGADAALDERQRLVIELTDRMTRERHVPDALYDRVRTAFDARQQVDLVATIAAYNMVSRLLVALEIGH
jgi:4-carboxymuconolactone decarboxylase